MRSSRIPAEHAERMDRLIEGIRAKDADPTAEEHAEAAVLHFQASDDFRLPWRRRWLRTEALLNAQLAQVAYLRDIRMLLEDIHQAVVPESPVTVDLDAADPSVLLGASVGRGKRSGGECALCHEGTASGPLVAGRWPLDGPGAVAHEECIAEAARIVEER